MHQILCPPHIAASTTASNVTSAKNFQRGDILSSPSKEDIENSEMILFATKYNLPLTYPELYKYSIAEGDDFWAKLFEYSALPFTGSPTPTREEGDITMVPRWFPNIKLNFCESLFNDRDPTKIALIHGGEALSKDHFGSRITFGDLELMVHKMALSFIGRGIKEGDVVAAIASNCPGVIIAALATSAIGAIFTTISPDFGLPAIMERLKQSKPSILFASKTVFYNGKYHSQEEKLITLLEILSIPIVVETMGSIDDEGIMTKIPFISWDSFINERKGEVFQYKRFPFNHPLYILYSSGTTGPPKCLIHSAGGTLLQHLKEHRLHGNMVPNSPDNILLQYTTIGWMMWHWSLSALALGSTICLWDGSPFKPDPLSMLEFASKEKVSHFGVGAKYIQHLETLTSHLPLSIDLSSSLKIIYSTGSPLSSKSFLFLSRNIPFVKIYSITGGTDIISLFAGGNPLTPVRAGEISSPCLGMSIAILQDGFNNNILKPFEDVGEGDLCCLRPFPSMPIMVGVLGSNDFHCTSRSMSSYQKTYFPLSPTKKVWYHGDYVEFTSSCDGGIIMRGRSDGTLNPGGVRFGSSEIYELLNGVFGISDSLVIGVKRGDDEDVILFLKLEDHIVNDVGIYSTDNEEVTNIKENVKKIIVESLSVRHLPKKIFITPSIPYTKNGKKVEVAIKKLLSSGQWDLPLGGGGGGGGGSGSEDTVISSEDVEYYRLLLKNGIL